MNPFLAVRRCLLSLFLLATLAFNPAWSANVAGVDLPDTLSTGSQTLTLNGAGVRSRFVFDIYVAALYTTARSADPAAIIAGPQPRAVQLVLLRDVEADTLLSGLKSGMRDNHTDAELAALAPSIQALEDTMKKIGNGGKGDTILISIADSGVTIRLRDSELGRIPDARLGAALLRIWLGDKPAQNDLKRALLGQP